MNPREALAVTCGRCGRAASSPAPLGMCPGCLADDVRTASEDAIRPLNPGARFRDFEIIGVLGRGGMGVVYRARQLTLARDVALKFLSPELSASPRFVERFEREAKSLAQLNHPNIVHVYDFGRDGTNLFLAMEFVDGPSLSRLIRDGLDHRTLKKILGEVAAGIHRIHEAGLVHRDIKPSNILIGKDGAARISDFGLALETESDARLTDSGVFVGSPAYASPETIRRGAVDGRSDLYSLGVVIYEALTGRPPFSAPYHAELLMKHVQESPPMGPVPAAWRPIVSRLLAKKPEARCAGAPEFLAELERVKESSPAKPWRPWMGAMGVVLAGILAALFLVRSPAETPGAVDLMALIDVERDTLIGDWEVRAGGLHSVTGATLMIPYAPPEEYDVSVTARGVGKADSSVQLVLLCGGRQFVTVIDGWGGRTGFSNLDDRWGMSNASTHVGKVIGEPGIHRIEFSVRRGAVQLQVDGRTIIDWQGDPARLNLPWTARVPDRRAMSLSAGEGWTVERLDLRPISGIGTELPHPVIDLLAKVDPVADAVQGSWRREGSSIACDGAARLQLPHAPGEDYDLVIRAERTGSAGAFKVGLVQKGRSFLVVLDDPSVAGGIHVPGAPKGAVARSGTAFDPGRVGEVQCSLAEVMGEPGRLIVLVGRNRWVMTRLDASTLPFDESERVPDPRALFLSCDAAFRIREIKLIPFYAPGTPLR